jgi:hypothetical protein
MRRRRCSIAILTASVAGIACTWIDPVDDISQPAHGDAGTDADAGADAASEAAPFCDTHDASFCDDFDHGTDVQGAWSRKVIEQGAISRAARTDAPSPPNVLVATVNASDLSTGIKAHLQKDFDVVPDEVHLEHDYRMDSPPTDGGVKLSVITLGGYELEVMVIADRIGLKECYSEAGCVEPPYVPYPTDGGAWTHVRVDFVKGQDGGAGSIALTFNGTLLHSRAPAATQDIVDGGLQLSVGIYYAGTTDPVEYAFDNVALSYR